MERNRADQLQFLRFIAFTLIFLWHANFWTPHWFPQGNGAGCAVSFFFILSGLGKAYSSYNKTNEFSFKSIISNLKKKVIKVYPLFFITTLIATGLTIPSYIAHHDFGSLQTSLIQLSKNLLFIQSWFSKGYYSFNGVTWFLSTIMFMYLLETPLIAIATKIKKTKYNFLYFISIICLTVVLIILYCYLHRNTNIEFWNYVFPPARLGEFVIGICLGYIVRLVTDKNIFLNKTIYTLLELFVLAFWIFMMYVSFENWKVHSVHWLLPNCLLLFIFTIGKGYISKLFCKYPFIRLGNISFECFLIHKIVIKIYIVMTGVDDISKLGNLFSLIVCYCVTVLIANAISKKTS